MSRVSRSCNSAASMGQWVLRLIGAFLTTYFRVPDSLMRRELVGEPLLPSVSPPNAHYSERSLSQENGNGGEHAADLKRRIANLEVQLETDRTNNDLKIRELEVQLQKEQRSARKVAELENRLKEQERLAEEHIGAKTQEIQRLVRQVEIAEHRNSQNFIGGESYLDTEATPHLFSRAAERVNTASGSFAKLFMGALSKGGINCNDVASRLAKSVSFERQAHCKYAYQALVCRVMFTDFENECFQIGEFAAANLVPEQARVENFRQYQQLSQMENPEDLVDEAAPNSHFRRFCIKKLEDFIVAVSDACAPDVQDLQGLVFGHVFGQEGLRKQAVATRSEPQVRLALSFLKLAQSVFMVHKVAFSMHPIARIFRVRNAVEFVPDYMEPVIEEGGADDDNTPIRQEVGFMVVPGFYVNRIIVRSRVYSVAKK